VADARLPSKLVTLLLITQQTTQEDPGTALHTVGPCKNHGIAGSFRPAVEKLNPAPMKQSHFTSWYGLIPAGWPQAFGSGVKITGKPIHRNPGCWFATLVLMQIE